MTLFRLTILLITVTLLSATNKAEANKIDALTIGVTSSLNKVFQTKPYDFKGEITNQINIELALNEYEASQIVLFPDVDISNIQISTTPLIHENNVNSISLKNIQINPIGYVNLVGGKETIGRKGFHPDILLPNQALALKKNIPQPVLVTVYTPPETKPGLYSTIISIKDNKGANSKVTLNVQVHPITIPSKPIFKSLSIARRTNYASLWPQEQGYKKISTQQERDIFRKIADIGFKKYLPPTAFLVNGLHSYNWKGSGKTLLTYPTHNKETGQFDPITTDKYIDYMLSKGANSFYIGITADIYKYEKNRQEREATLLKYLDDLIPHLKKRGVLDDSYLYNIDEPWGEAVDHAKKIYRLVKKRYGHNIHVIQNTNQNNDRILDNLKHHFQAIDINLGFYNLTEIEQHREQYPEYYKDVWWNVNLWPRSRPNLFIEYPLIDARILGPMSFRYNIQGFEYWELTYIKKIKNYHPVKANDFHLKWVIGNHSLDGLLLYPNENYDFYSSMRFESFRDGMEDLELLYQLQKLDPENELLEISLVSDIDDYNEDIAQYTIFRKKLINEIKQLQ